jgi:Ni/Fe-hydrogenase subunit HybB-like protein
MPVLLSPIIAMATMILSIYLQSEYMQRIKCHSTPLWPHPLWSIASLFLSVLFWIFDIDSVTARVFFLMKSFCLIFHQVSKLLNPSTIAELISFFSSSYIYGYSTSSTRSCTQLLQSRFLQPQLKPQLRSLRGA